MKTLSETLLLEQKRASRKPAISLAIESYSHPEKAGGSSGAAADGLYPGLFNWTRLYQTDAISPNYHGVAIPGDGSLNRVRKSGLAVYHQRIASPSPGSDFGANWTNLEMTTDHPCAIAAHGSEVIVIADVPGATPPYTSHRLSTDNGQTFGEATVITGAHRARRALAIAYKPNGDCALVGADADNPLWICRRVGGYWGPAHGFTSPPQVEGLAMYYDGDWNIIALVNVYNQFQLVRVVYGDGYRVNRGFWSPYEFLNLGRATVDAYDLIQQYYDQPREERMPLPLPPTRRDRRGNIIFRHSYMTYWREFHPRFAHPRAFTESWTKVSAILAARAIDNLGLDAPFICKPAGAPPVLSVYKQGDRWCFRLRPGTDFYDSDWNRAFKQQGSCTYGLALACDSNYIWGTRANEVWRSPLPAQGWLTPTAGSGASGTPTTIPQEDIISAEETIRAMARSELELVLDNSAGRYADLPTNEIRIGSRVAFATGYHTTGGAETPAPNYYFIEHWSYDRAANEATVTISCLDAWGLLEKYAIPGYHEFNYASDEYTVYDLIEKLLACIGATLDYKSRSSDITSIYPKVTVHAGETGAGLLKRLLDLVPDVIYFEGLTAYIVYPQASDSHVYSYNFPGGA